MTFPFSTKILQGVILLCLLIDGASGLQCLECEEVYNQDDCALVGTCGKGEVCFTRQFINFRERPAYRMGCEDRDVCELYKSHQQQGNILIGRRAADGALCRQCCEDNFCNADLCRDTPSHTTHIIGQGSSGPAHTESLSPGFTTAPVSSSALPSSPGTTEFTTVIPNTWMRNCLDYLHNGVATSGVYAINPDGLPPFNIYCDMTTDGGGWMVVQRRLNGSVDFEQNWDNYKHGFGSLNGEFWLGNEYLHRLTSVPGINYTLRFRLTAQNGTVYTAEYSNFTVAEEGDGYRVNFTSYQGNAGDSFSKHRGMQFSTFDHDLDTGKQNCAALYKGGWWYSRCYDVNINGVYGSSGDLGLVWYGLTGWTEHLTATSMSIRAS